MRFPSFFLYIQIKNIIFVATLLTEDISKMFLAVLTI